jgi:hypothetical protein
VSVTQRPVIPAPRGCENLPAHPREGTRTVLPGSAPA